MRTRTPSWDIKIRILARQRFLEVDADQKLDRLLNARGRAEREFAAGDFVFEWRNIWSGKKTKNIGRPGARGCWLGPALIVAMSKRVDGSSGSNVFLEASGRLVVSQSQLRPVAAAEVGACCILTGSESVPTIDEARLRIRAPHDDDSDEYVIHPPELVGEDDEDLDVPVPRGEAEDSDHPPADAYLPETALPRPGPEVHASSSGDAWAPRPMDTDDDPQQDEVGGSAPRRPTSET